MIMKKKALAIVSNPFSLIQVIWFTILYSEYDWDLIVRYRISEKIMISIKQDAIKSGCFQKVDTISYSERYAGNWTKIIDFLKMIFHFIFGKRKEYCRRLIKKYIDGTGYNLLCLETSASNLEGALLNYSDEILTIMLQEGTSEYVNGTTFFYPFFLRIAGKILYKMKYVNILLLNGFYFNRYCIKYVVNPSALLDQSYREVYKLFDGEEILLKRFYQILQQTYQLDAFDYDVVIFTTHTQSLIDFEDIEALKKWLLCQYRGKRILLKRHPGDIYTYDWKELDISCKYENVPGEVILSYIKNAEIIFTYPSSILLNITDINDYNYKIIKYEIPGMRSYYESNFEKVMHMLKIDKDKCITIYRK